MYDIGWEIVIIISRLIRSHLGSSLIKFLMTVAKSLNFYYGKFSANFHMYTQKHIQEKERKAISYVKLQIFLKYLSLKRKACEKLWDIWKPLIKQVATCANHRVALRNLGDRTTGLRLFQFWKSWERDEKLGHLLTNSIYSFIHCLPYSRSHRFPKLFSRCTFLFLLHISIKYFPVFLGNPAFSACVYINANLFFKISKLPVKLGESFH